MIAADSDHFTIVRIVAAALLSGAVITANVEDGAVTASNGTIVDWRHVRSGEQIDTEQSSAADTAILFVAMVGDRAARKSVDQDADPLAVEIHEWPLREGNRIRSFKVGGYEVSVSRDWGASEDFDDDDARDFTRRLAAAAVSL